MDVPRALLLVGSRARGVPPRKIAIQDEVFHIGRAPENHLVIRDVAASKRHAAIHLQNDTYVLLDLASANGTLVDGELTHSCVLHHGAELKIGTTRMAFMLDPPPPHDGPPVCLTRGLTSEHAPAFLATSPMNLDTPGAQIGELEHLRQAYDRMRVGFDAVQRLIQIRDVTALCHQIIDVTFQLVPVEAATVLIAGPTGDLLPRVQRYRSADRRSAFRYSRTVLAHVMGTREAVLAADILADERFAQAESLRKADTRSLMCVALTCGDQVHGVLYAASISRRDPINRRDLELLQGIGAGAGVALSNALLAERLAQEVRAREGLSRYMAPVLVEQALTDRLGPGPGEESTVTVLFSDIRDFTRYAEARPAADVVALLNEYFQVLVDIVFNHQGILDKFMGDGLMAVWGTPASGTPEQGHAAAAVAAAQDMCHALAGLNEDRARRELEPIQAGIGVATGLCVVGNIGTPRRMEYTVIGQAVNLACRLSDRAGPQEILLDHETFERAGSPARWRQLEPLIIRGMTEQVLAHSSRSVKA